MELLIIESLVWTLWERELFPRVETVIINSVQEIEEIDNSSTLFFSKRVIQLCHQASHFSFN